MDRLHWRGTSFRSEACKRRCCYKVPRHAGIAYHLSSEANETHLHSVPKCKGCTGVRYSVNCKALPISISNPEVQETIPSSPDRNDVSSTSVASLAKSKPQKDAKTVNTNYQQKPSFLTEEEAGELYSTVMNQHLGSTMGTEAASSTTDIPTAGEDLPSARFQTPLTSCRSSPTKSANSQSIL